MSDRRTGRIRYQRFDQFLSVRSPPCRVNSAKAWVIHTMNCSLWELELPCLGCAFRIGASSIHLRSERQSAGDKGARS